ncbi:hypothetical protein HK096_009824 [Nowakowskiella sp. JEL0078]|nr:hypothetical protein HK096_009824 [Nowakowskiella sp. JEL0078]
MLNVIAFDTLMSVIDKMVDISENIRNRLKIPIQRSAIKFFTPEIEETPIGETNVIGNPNTVMSANSKILKDDSSRKLTPQHGNTGAAQGAGKKPDAKDIKKGPAPNPDKKTEVAKKGGTKRVVETPVPETLSLPTLTKLIPVPPKKPLSSRGWTTERRLLEKQYQNEFKDQVELKLSTAVDRMCALFEDVHAIE